MNKKQIISTVVALMAGTWCMAQPLVPVTADRYLIFKTTDKGIQHEGIKWGLDTAWDDEGNIKRGIAFMGKENVDVIRVSFQPTYALIGDTALTRDQLNAVNSRIRHAKLAGTPELIINDDHAKVDTYFTANDRANIDHWAHLIMITKRLYEKAGLKVIGISPFNEPDYGWGQGSKSDFRQICQKIKEEYADEMEGIRLSGGNTLNSDQASSWYNYLKPYIDEGNTHQLAGSFDTYANFFKEVRKDGLHATADEMHNVGDALVALEYGLQTGIWWGYDGRARGQMCRATHGDRLAYAENRDKWNVAAVYRNNQDNKIECFIGGSERQAGTSSYAFVCADKLVYFDGYGPTHSFAMQYPGGTGYQSGQTNAERVIDVTYGEDVQPAPINGTYILMNKATKMVMSLAGAAGSGTNVCMKTKASSDIERWKIEPVDSRIGGDFSYFTIHHAASDYSLNIWNWSLDNGGDIRLFNGGSGNNEQWFLKYAGNGFYYICSRHSNLYISAASTTAGANVQQGTLGNTESKRNLQLWRIIPVDAKCELVPPAVPTGLTATSLSASIKLSWVANTDKDIDGYMILRSEKGTDEWNTIARKVKECSFTDQTCRQDKTYIYKIKAIDYSENMSGTSDEVEAETLHEPMLIGHWQFDENADDYSDNEWQIGINGEATYSTISLFHKSGTAGLSLDGQSNFIQLPYELPSSEEMTICMWVRWSGSSLGSGQRIIDFGNSENEYMYLTPSTGSKMRFGIKNGGDEQYMDAPSRLPSTGWKHLALVISKESIKLYMDAELLCESSDITIRPSDFKPVLNYIGKSQFSNHPLFKGYVDDLRIFNYPLTEADLATIMEDIENGIDGIEMDRNDMKTATYDMQGRKVTNNLQRGLYIKNGKKIFVK